MPAPRGRFERLKEVALVLRLRAEDGGPSVARLWRGIEAAANPPDCRPPCCSLATSPKLLIVDVQDKLLNAISGKDRVIDRCVRLVLAARMLDVPDHHVGAISARPGADPRFGPRRLRQ